MIILLIILAVLAYFLLKRRKLSGPLTLKKESWHTWLYSWFYDGQSLPKDICAYFWSMVFALLSLMVLLAIFLGIFVGIPAFAGILASGFSSPEEAYAAGLTFLNLWLSGAGLISLIVGVIWTISANLNTEFAKIVKSFIQSKKDKTCIEIQWKDSVDSDETE